MVELNESLSPENNRTLEPFFDDAAEKIQKLKKSIDILSLEYEKFLTWLGMPRSSQKVEFIFYIDTWYQTCQSWTPSRAAEVLLDLRQEVRAIAGHLEEDAKKQRKKSARANRNSDINNALKEKLASRRGKVRKSLRNILEKNE